ncbi:MAG: ATP synthase F1 subunit delta [Phycisphaerales bacterium]|nr:ATP synthase F1 subunit delta [Phycisphaerales bacterium]
MADNEFQIESIGSVYAQALINEAQKQGEGTLPEVTEDIRGIATLLKTNPLFASFTAALTIGEEERLATLDKIFQNRIHPLTLNTLKALSRRDRLMFLRGFLEGFEDILKKMSGLIDVQLTSSFELPPESLTRIQQVVSQNLGQQTVIHTTINPSLIGGMTLRIGDTLIDGSVVTQLAKIEDQLKTHAIGKLNLESVTT